MSLQPDHTILNGKYRILRLIGEGAFARVWLAEETEFGGRQVAIKEPRADRMTGSEADELAQRFRQEVDLAAQLERAAVQGVIRALTVERLGDDTRLLVMEYAGGGSLAGMIAAHPEGLPVTQAVGIVRQVARALDGFHGLPVSPVHRDIKPSNVLLTAAGEARLSDFGLAQLPGASGRSTGTGAGHPGTPNYMAPEQARSSEPLTPMADVFALGCVLYEMLTGKVYKRVRPGTKARALRPDLPAWMDDVLARALDPDPWGRYESAGALSAALEEEQVARDKGQSANAAATQAGRSGAEEQHKGSRVGSKKGSKSASAATLALMILTGLAVVVVLVLRQSLLGGLPSSNSPSNSPSVAITPLTSTHTSTSTTESDRLSSGVADTPTPSVISSAKLTPTPTKTPSRIPTRTTASTPTNTPASTSPKRPPATDTPTLTPTIRPPGTAVPRAVPAILLNSPPDDESFSGPAAQIRLVWQQSGWSLGANEYYLVTVLFPHDSATWTDYQWTRSTELLLPSYLHSLVTGDRRLTWAVSAVKVLDGSPEGDPTGRVTVLQRSSQTWSLQWNYGDSPSPSTGLSHRASPAPPLSAAGLMVAAIGGVVYVSVSQSSSSSGSLGSACRRRRRYWPWRQAE